MHLLRSLVAFATLTLGCDVYESTLVEGGGGNGGDQGGGGSGGDPGGGGSGGSGAAGAAGPGPGGGGSGGGPACNTPADCPGTDTECGSRTCADGVCGVEAEAAGTVAATQSPEDCQRNICDGAGSITTENDNADVEDDNNDCTIDTCEDGAPIHTPGDEFELCEGGAAICTAEGECVECIDDIDCSGTDVCTPENLCVPATCDDNQLNGQETDTDCGGPTCGGCAFGEFCDGDTDCLSSNCDLGVCEGSCTDGILNQDESDLDCGGVCGPCAVGDTCDIDEDCASGTCGPTTCGEYQILISEMRPSGPGAGTDDYIEIYNPLDVDVTLPADLEIVTRAGTGSTYTVKFTGSGQVLPSHEHFLIAGGGYPGTADVKLGVGNGLVPDKPSIVVRRGGTVIDAACFYFGGNPFGGVGFICEGTPFLYVSGNSDRGFERGPGGAAGSGDDTGDTLADFTQITPADPQHLGSPPTP